MYVWSAWICHSCFCLQNSSLLCKLLYGGGYVFCHDECLHLSSAKINRSRSRSRGN
jgi:hypothetical protein